jgi:hypothetical protein
LYHSREGGNPDFGHILISSYTFISTETTVKSRQKQAFPPQNQQNPSCGPTGQHNPTQGSALGKKPSIIFLAL